MALFKPWFGSRSNASRAIQDKADFCKVGRGSSDFVLLLKRSISALPPSQVETFAQALPSLVPAFYPKGQRFFDTLALSHILRLRSLRQSVPNLRFQG
jgi:hypothetical protein